MIGELGVQVADHAPVDDVGEVALDDAPGRRRSAERRLSFEMLVELVAVVASLTGAASEGTDR